MSAPPDPVVCQRCGGVLVLGDCPTCSDSKPDGLGAAEGGALVAMGVVALGVWAISRGLGSVEVLAPITATVAMLSIPALGLLRVALARARGAHRLRSRRRAARPLGARGEGEHTIEGDVELAGEEGALRLRVRYDGGVLTLDPSRAVVRGDVDLGALRAGREPRVRARVTGHVRSVEGQPDAEHGYRDARAQLAMDDASDAAIVELARAPR